MPIPMQQMLLSLGAKKEKVYVDDLFSTNVWLGNKSNRTITTGINTSEEGGLVWIKKRSGSEEWAIYDTERGATKRLKGNATTGEETLTGGLTGFTTTGFTHGTDNSGNDDDSGTDHKYLGWSFRSKKKFFDVVSYTGTGSARTVSHSLGSVPGMIIVKCSSDTHPWQVYHRGVDSSSPEDYALVLNSPDAREDYNEYWNDTAPTSTVFSLGTDPNVNGSSKTYVAYLFAHHDGDGGFGEGGDQDIIKHGTYTGNGSTKEVVLGWEPQWVMVKGGATGGTNWWVIDCIRGMVTGGNAAIMAVNYSNVEYNNYPMIEATSTGFKAISGALDMNANNGNYIFTAIRRPDGYVGKPPKLGTDVFAMDTGASSSTIPNFDSNFPVDFILRKEINATASWYQGTRLTGTKYLVPNSNATEATSSGWTWDSNVGWNSSGVDSDHQSYQWKRHAGFDVVAYEGTNSAGLQIAHSLNAVPEMMIIKNRDAGENWAVYHKGLNGGTNPQDYVIRLNSTSAEFNHNEWWNDTAPTSTHFTLGISGETNGFEKAMIAMLFTSTAVSKVGYYTGNGSTQTITTGFAPRFAIIRRTDGSEDHWVVLDTTRGWGSGNDQALKLNSSDTQSGFDVGAPTSTGFSLTSDGWVNANTGNYIYYAHA